MERVAERAISPSVYLIEFAVGLNCVGGIHWGERINLITDLCGTRRHFMAPECAKRGRKAKEFVISIGKIMNFQGQ